MHRTTDILKCRVSYSAYVQLAVTLCVLACATFTHADTKRGMAGSQDQRENAMNVRWAYNWGIEPNHDVSAAHYEHVPMIWRGSPGGVQGQIDRVLNLETNFGTEVDYVLGFNEPERTDQANMTVQTALNTWDVMTDGFAGTGIELVSPAVSGSGGVNNWLRPFMDEVELRNADADPNNDLQVDAIGLHWYSTGNNPISQANNILNAIDSLWNDYGRPIWLTEFAGVDFSGNTATEVKVQFNEDFLEYIIPELESRDHVARYAWWQFGIGGKPYSRLQTNSGGVYTPTGIGDEYAGSLLSGDAYDLASGDKQPTDVHYLRGGALTNTGTAITTAMRAIDSIEGTGVITGQADYGVSGGSDAFVRVRSGATLQKLGSNTISFQGIPVSNDGTLRVTAGRLSLETGIQVTGTGVLQLDSGGTLSLGTASDTTGSSVNQAIELKGGTVLSNPLTNGSNTIAGSVSVDNLSTFSGAGDLTITGTLAGGSGIIKSGTGTLLVNGNNTYTGGTSVQGGQLMVASLSGSATGTGPVLVASSGTLGGVGLVDGEILIQSGGKLAPGLSQFNLDTEILSLGDNYTQLDLATLEIELGGTSNPGPGNAEFDQLLIAGDALLDGILDLSIVEGFTPSVGDTFDIILANSISGMFDTINVPSGMNLGVNYLGSTVQVEVLGSTLGDFDGDGDVDGEDFLVLQRGLGTTYDASDLADWQNNYDNGGLLAVAIVPEPSTFTMVFLTVFVATSGGRVRTRKEQQLS